MYQCNNQDFVLSKKYRFFLKESVEARCRTEERCFHKLMTSLDIKDGALHLLPFLLQKLLMTVTENTDRPVCVLFIDRHMTENVT